MQNDLFQNVFDLLLDFLSEQWDTVIFFAGYTNGSYSMKFYIKDEQGQYKDCFELGFENIQLVKLFMAIDRVLTKERNNLEDKSRWNVLSMNIKSNGNMKTDFDYSDISENSIKYEENWKKKYLV